MTLLEIYEYFEAYAVTNLELKHVPDDSRNQAFIAALSEDEAADELIRSCQRELIMVMLPYEKRMLPVTMENFVWGKTIVFLVIEKLSKPNGKDIIRAQSRCEQIADDFITKIIADRTEKLGTVELSSFAMQPVGPISDFRYGQICLFNLEDYFEHWVKPERWSA